MDSFEDLGVGGSLVEALAGEGIEKPTPLQASAYPVLRRGNSAVIRAAPGSGGLVAYAVPLFDTVDPESAKPAALILAGDRSRASALALGLARLSVTTGHRVGALGVPWSHPEDSALLVSTIDDLAWWVDSARVKLDAVRSLVLDGASGLLEDPTRMGPILAALPTHDLQMVLRVDEVTPGVRRFVDDHARRAVYLPPDAGGADADGGVERGSVRIRVVDRDDPQEIARVVADLLDEGHAHVLAYCRSEDRAADLGDALGLRGYVAGRPGDPDAELWLGIDSMEGRGLLRERDVASGSVSTVSIDAPPDADELDRRHGGGSAPGVILALPREIPHVKTTAQEAGYRLLQWPAATSSSALDEGAEFLAEVEGAVDEEDLLPYLHLLEPLFGAHAAEEVAAALAALLRASRTRPDASPASVVSDVEIPGSRPPAWIRLFLSLGSKDGVGPGDVLGAILGESGIRRSQVGRIDLRDTFSRVEVHEAVADQVIRALNGTTIRGRSIRADFDRKEGRSAPRPAGRTEKGGGRG